MPVPGFTRENLLRHRLTRRPVAVGIPTTEMVIRESFHQFLHLARDGMKHGDVVLPIRKVAVPAEARNTMIHLFLELDERFEFLFLFDSDMVVPNEALDVMSGYDVPFVSGYCSLKQYPYMPIPAVKAEIGEYDGKQIQGYRQVTNWPVYSGIHECDGVGAAALCLRRDLLEAIPPPWFEHGEGGEDYYFCRKVQECTALPGYETGVPILITTDVPVGHIGTLTAWPQMWFEVKDAYFAENPDGAYEIDAPVIGVPNPKEVPTAAD